MKKLAWILFLSGLLLPLAGCTINPRLLSSVQPQDSSSSWPGQSSEASSSGTSQTSASSSQPGAASDTSGGGYIQRSRPTDEGFVPHNYGGVITYGFDPQTVVTDGNLIRALDRLDGSHYLQNGSCEYGGKYYYREGATPYSADCYFANSEWIEPNKPYWFVCEPIRWIVLGEYDEGYLCLSENVLEQWIFGNFYDGYSNGHYANAWQDSALQDFLNDKFIFNAFILSNPDSFLWEVTNDNSPASTEDSNNEPNGDTTYDRGFALCYQDFCNYNFAFSNDDPFKRHAPASDYAMARGVEYANNAGGFYWTRSPSLGGYKEAWAIDENGYFRSTYIEDAHVGVRPAIYLKRFG